MHFSWSKIQLSARMYIIIDMGVHEYTDEYGDISGSKFVLLLLPKMWI